MKQWVYPYLRQFKGRILLSLFFGLLGVGSGTMLLFISGYLISKSSLQPENIMIVYVPIVSVRAFSIGRATFLYIEKLMSHDIVLRMLENMRRKLYNILEPQALFLRARYKTGDLLGVLSEDIEHLQDLYLRTIFPSLLGLIIYALIISVIGLFDWTFAIMLLCMLGVLVFLTPFISFMKMRTHHETLKIYKHQLYRKLTDTIFGIADWQASGRWNKLIHAISTQDENMSHVEKKMKKWRHIRDGIIQGVIGIVIISMILWTSVQADRNVISATVIAAFILMIFSVTEALTPISEAVEQMPSYTDSIDRITNIEQPNVPKRYERNDAFNRKNYVHLQIKDMSFRYADNEQFTLKHLSLNIKQGEKLAILGRSGSGKSTLLKLMAGGLKPTEGSILMNGQTMHSGLLAEAVSVLNQKPHLFATTMANNIRIGRPDASEEEILQAADLAQLTPLIRSLPQGIHTHMQELGSRFSGGERQRIAFARILLQQTPVILIDEATIGLDPVTEHQLIDTMLTAAQDKTIVWVTHHLAGAEKMNNIIFLKEGKIFMEGSHQHLIQTNAYYRRLYNMENNLLLT